MHHAPGGAALHGAQPADPAAADERLPRERAAARARERGFSAGVQQADRAGGGLRVRADRRDHAERVAALRAREGQGVPAPVRGREPRGGARLGDPCGPQLHGEVQRGGLQGQRGQSRAEPARELRLRGVAVSVQRRVHLRGYGQRVLVLPDRYQVRVLVRRAREPHGRGH